MWYFTKDLNEKSALSEQYDVVNLTIVKLLIKKQYWIKANIVDFCLQLFCNL